ncbi:hypothetical protein CBS101457_006338 [Exobasidium rhododendri]|nr:hypothetical protein CBS101457_006338 [Exobasidium rhododendri]
MAQSSRGSLSLARDFPIRNVLNPGDQMTVGGKETGVEDPLDIVQKMTPVKTAHNYLVKTDSNRPFKVPSKKPVWGKKDTSVITESKPVEAPISVSAQSFYGKHLQGPRGVEKAKLPSDTEKKVRGKSTGSNARLSESPQSRYDISAPGSIIMKRPDKNHEKIYNSKKLPVVDVMIAPELGSALREHQVEGVRFLYDRVVGLRPADEDDHLGAILADDMGLGKTLQTITLIDMLLNQNCYYSPILRTIERALIVCPLSVVKNWAREFRKWLGNKIKVQCIDDKTKIESTINGNYQVLIIGYEKLLTSHTQIRDVQPRFGLLVCDEAHRLKNLMGKTSVMLNDIRIDRRILLTGTPIQNNLMEFHAMLELVAPGILGNQSTFKKCFEDPILKSRIPNCSSKVMTKGRKANTALQVIADEILLRRTSEILNKFLPPKFEEVVFCSPSALQVKIYEMMLNSEGLKGVISGDRPPAKTALNTISLLRKLCNSPELLIKNLKAERGSEETSTQKILQGVDKLLPPQVMNNVEMSGKLICVSKMLQHIKQKTTDKVVVVSSFTATLDILEGICRKQKYKFLRLDGQTKEADRNHNINEFNISDRESSFVFLLSTKAGGTGINLIGANRLILFDSDWNPSHDRQAMARIHRDGQKKPCYIYRILLSGTMDEKIYQRQVSKLSLSDSLMDSAAKSSKSTESFTPEELRDIFRLHLDSPCPSHVQMMCNCAGNGVAGAGMDAIEEEAGGSMQSDEDEDEDNLSPPPLTFVKASQVKADQVNENRKEGRAKLATLLKWAHYDCLSIDTPPTKDPIINGVIALQQDMGVYLDDESADRFDMGNVKAGTILYLYEEAMKRKKSDGEEQASEGSSSRM